VLWLTKKFLYHHLVFFTLLSLCLALLIVIAVFLLDEPKFGIPNIARFSGIIIAVVAGFVSSKFFHTIFAIAAPIISLVVMELDKRHIEKREQSGVT